VYLFAEVDALGGERGRDNDVGEIRRVLNSFLQFLEQDQSDSLLVAAANHPQLLDRAMFRRFDAVIDYPLPTAEIARDVIRNRLATVRIGRIGWAQVDKAAAGLSHGRNRPAGHSTERASLPHQLLSDGGARSASHPRPRRR
jgi:SpoVK/Ycf46/Vps4 family AAA+-type ATPase